MSRKPLADTMFKTARRTRRGCWIWSRGNNGLGYGRVQVDGKTVYAHRHSYAVHKGPIPDGADVCHTCDVRACINPSHLFLGDALTNGQDCAAKGRTTHGERNTSAKLSSKDVRSLRRKASSGKLNRTAEAARLGVSRGTVSRAVNGASWNKL